MCKSDSHRVVLVRAHPESDGSDHTKSFEELFRLNLPIIEELGMYFADDKIKEEVVRVAELRCYVPRCREGKRVWSSKQELKHHVHNAHQLSFCDICLLHKKAFPSEYKVYNRAELIQHQKDRIAGHPPCTVCGTLFYSDDELTAHCREKHEQCHICQRQRGAKPSYHRDYAALEEHFRKEHYLCVEPLCLELKFVVFETEVEYKTHIAEVHMSNMKMQRSAQQQFRRIDTGFSYGDERRRQQGGGRKGPEESSDSRSRREEINTQPKVSSTPPSNGEPVPRSVLRHLLYGEAIGDLAQRLQSLTMYEQRNIDFCESLRRDHGISDNDVATMKGHCRQFQRGEISAVDLVLRLDALMGHVKLEQIGPILIDLELDAQKRMQLGSAIRVHLQRIAAFPPLPMTPEPDYLRSRSGLTLRASTPTTSKSAPGDATVLRIKPTPKSTVYNRGLVVDPSRNPLALLGATGKISSGRSTKSVKSQPPSFRQAIATSSSTAIVEDSNDRLKTIINENEFPSLSGQQSPTQSSTPSGTSDNIFASSGDRDEPESFTIGEATSGKGTTEVTASKSGKKKKGQVVLRYG